MYGCHNGDIKMKELNPQGLDRACVHVYVNQNSNFHLLTALATGLFTEFVPV